MVVSAIQGNWDPPALVPFQDASEAVATVRALPGAEVPGWVSEGVAPPSNGADDASRVDASDVGDVQDAWTQLLAEMRLQMTRVTYDMWLRGSEIVKVEGGIASVLVRDAYAADWLEARWLVPIERTLGAIVGQQVSVRFLSSQGRV
jgi:hypothetical protein